MSIDSKFATVEPLHSSSILPPFSSSTYWSFHVHLTFPPLLALILLTHRFFTRAEIIKLVTFSFLALFYTTPWDNYVVHRGAWSYGPGALGYIGLIPIEEYAFFVIQTFIVGMWTIFITRFDRGVLEPAEIIRKQGGRVQNWGAAMFGLLTFAGVGCVVLEERLFYIGMVFAWVSPVFALLWWYAGDTIVKRWKRVLVATVVPSMYLCVVDRIAISRRTWSISESKILGYYVAEELPFEEAMFFFVTNFMLVCACFAFDRGMEVGTVVGIKSYMDVKKFRDVEMTKETLETAVKTFTIEKDEAEVAEWFVEGSKVLPKTVRFAMAFLPGAVAVELVAMHAAEKNDYLRARFLGYNCMELGGTIAEKYSKVAERHTDMHYATCLNLARNIEYAFKERKPCPLLPDGVIPRWMARGLRAGYVYAEMQRDGGEWMTMMVTKVVLWVSVL